MANIVSAGIRVLLVALVLIVATRGGHIFKWDVTTSYRFDGQPNQCELTFKLESGLGAQDYIYLVWPFSLGPYDLISASLFVFDSKKQIGKSKPAAPESTNSSVFRYYFCFEEELLRSTWYRLVIKIDESVVQTISDLQQKPI